MTVTTSYTPLAYAWTSSNQELPVTWPFLTGTLVVTAVSSAGIATAKTEGTDYTVSGGTDSNGLPQTGAVTMIGSAVSGSTLVVARATTVTQQTEWIEHGPFPAKAVEAAFDKSVLMVQEIDDGALRKSSDGTYWDAGSVPVRSSATPSNNADLVPLGYATANYGAAALMVDLRSVLDEYDPGAPNALAYQYETRASVKAVTVPILVNHIHVSGFWTKGVGGGVYVRTTAPPTPDASYIQDASGAWFALSDPCPNVWQFGAVPTSTGTTPVSDKISVLAEAQALWPDCASTSEEINDLAFLTASQSSFVAVAVPGGMYYGKHYKLARQCNLYGVGRYHGTGGTSVNPAPVLVGIATDGGAMVTIDTTTNTIYSAISGISILGEAGSDYDWLLDIPEAIGVSLANILITTNTLNTGGLRMIRRTSGTPGPTWVNELDRVIVILPGWDETTPYAATEYSFYTDTTDTHIVKCEFVGGKGVYKKGSGIVNFSSGRIDHSVGYNLTIVRDVVQAVGGVQCIGTIFEQCIDGQVYVDIDTYDSGVPTIYPKFIGCHFVTPAGSGGVAQPSRVFRVVNASGSEPSMGGTIIGCTFHAHPANVFEMDNSGVGWVIGPNQYDTTPTLTSVSRARLYDYVGRARIGSSTASGTSVVFTGSWPGYEELRLVGTSLVQNGATQSMYVDVSTNGGSTWVSSATGRYMSESAGTPAAGTVTDGKVSGPVTFGTTGNISITVSVAGINASSTAKNIISDFSLTTPSRSGEISSKVMGTTASINAINAIRLRCTSGSFTGGTVTLYGS